MRWKLCIALACAAALPLSLSCDGGGGPAAPIAVASVALAPDSAVLQPGGAAQFTATTRDARGGVLAGRTVTWSSADVRVASVTAAGLVQAVAPGRVAIAATSEGKTGSALVVVASPAVAGDVAILGAQLTQGVQDSDGSIPIVLGGGAAAVNVLLRSSVPAPTPMQVVLRLFDASGALVRADTALTHSDLTATPTYEAPSVQFLVPAASLQAGLRWQVVRDPRHQAPDDSAADDVFPRAGPAALSTVTVPPLTVRFIPIVLTSNGNATGDVSAANVNDYLVTVRSIHPLGQINAHVGSALATAASFGTAPSGGDSGFWLQLIAEIDLARIADPTEPTVNWYGIVRPPAGFNYTSFGGFSYIPLSGADVGAHTRTSASVQLNWFSRPTQARDLIAHELAHTFGRLHAPCGNPSGIDPAYPVPGGLIDVAGTDVFSWATGLTAGAPAVSTTTGDVMGYCFPVWESTYTYRGILAFRAQAVAGPGGSSRATSLPAATRVLVVRGSVRSGGAIQLEPTFTLTARPVLPEHAGPYRLEGRDADGRGLFSYAFEPAIPDHAPDVRHFTIALPLTTATASVLETLVVRGPAAEARITRPAALPEAAPAAQPARAQRSANGTVAVRCPATSAAGVLVRDAATGTVLGSARGAVLPLPARAGTTLDVLCSDGFSTRAWRLDAPR